MRILDLLPQRVADRIVISDGCWEYSGWHNSQGYAYTHWQGRDVGVHRLVVHVANGLAFDDLEDTDHLCRNPGCVNPDHLEPVTHAENIRRIRDRQLTCRKAGHPRTSENLYVRANGRTYCAECCRIAAREKWARRHADS